jgi:superfamily I DNA/RNA helicase
VDTHALTLTSTVQLLQSSVASRPQAADVVLTTVHKAKGLQWPTVQLGSDFLPFMQSESSGASASATLQPEEVHCLYVAITRAESHLDWHGIHPVLNTSWRQWKQRPAPSHTPPSPARPKEPGDVAPVTLPPKARMV